MSSEEELLAHMGTALAVAPERNPCGLERDQLYAFLALLRKDYRTARTKIPGEPENAMVVAFWDRVLLIASPFQRAWDAWTTAREDSDARDTLDRALFSFWVGFGAFPLEEVASAVSPATLTTWQSVRQSMESLARARARYFVVPRLPAEALTFARAGHLAPNERPTFIPPSTRHTFAIPSQWPNARYWKVLPARGVALALPLEGRDVQDSPAPHIRGLLTGGALRLWLATWVLAAEQGDSMGGFRIVPRHIICDLYNRQPETVTCANGKRYERAPRRYEQDLWRHIEVLCSVYLCGIGNMQMETPEALIQRHAPSDPGNQLFYHAPTAWKFSKLVFTQIPRAVLQLDSIEAPLALGLANFWRMHMTSVLRGAGCHHTTLEVLAIETGEDSRAGCRHDGTAYWKGFVTRLSSVLEKGELGVLHAIEGEGPKARVTLEPSGTLAAVYLPLAEASDRQRELTRQTEFEAMVQARLPKRRPGRPRKP